MQERYNRGYRLSFYQALILFSQGGKSAKYTNMGDNHLLSPDSFAKMETLPRFYCPGPIIAEQALALPGAVAHHAFHVLRLRQGDKLTLFNGEGGEYPAKILSAGPKNVIAMPERRLDIERESQLVVTLVQALCSNEKMGWIVQKSVELGVSCFQPVTTRFGVVKLSGDRIAKRMAHWQDIVISACEQCGRNRIPAVLPLMPLSTWLESMPDKCKNPDGPYSQKFFMLLPAASKGLRDFPGLSSPGRINLLVGPEGGFDADEEAAALVAGFIPLRLGKRLLRTESAGLAGLAAMQAICGDY
jgi:16S rRNA (uracil1498-N3)-methyltransferase